MRETKYVWCSGLAFKEEEDMKKLSQYAQHGWIFEKVAFLGFAYKLKKRESLNIEYTLDFQKDADDEYFTLFQDAGWTHVYSLVHLHIFHAPAGTKPIYTDKQTAAEKFERLKKDSGIVAFISLVAFLLTLGLTIASHAGLTPSIVGNVSLLLIIIV